MPGVIDVEPPLHVRATFGVRDADMVVHGRSWRCDEVLITRADDHARATWSAAVRETLQVEGVRVARPVRSTDGRWVVAGWVADTFLVGEPEPRYDEVIAVAGRLHTATAALPRPAFLAPPRAGAPTTGVFDTADRAAWGEELGPFTDGPGAATATGSSSVTLFRELARRRTPISGAAQVVHGDLFGTVLFAGSAAPGLTELTPFWHPPAWAAAVVVVDALAWGDGDDGLVRRWSGQPEWPQMLLRALLFRLAVHTLHDRSTPEAFPGLVRTAELVRRLV